MTYPNSDYYVHEFSRQLIDTSKKDGRWVSGGFGKEVGESEFPIPEQIKQAVNQGEFRINDNYPPADGEHALIAKEIDDYSVLAVATREFDDKGNRNLVAYRYFWLKRIIKDMDGVGTLLEWWINQGEPKFEFEQSTQTSLNYLPQYYYPIKRFEAYLQPQQLEKFITEVKFFPYVCKDKCQRRVLHALALHLHQKYANTPVAWAWNVRLLEKSASYNLTLIYCADDTAYKYISEDVKSKLKQLIPIPQTTSIQSQNQGEEVNYLNTNRQRSHSVLQLGELAPSTGTEQYQQPGATSTEQYQQPGATSTEQYQQPGANVTGQYQQPGATATEQYQQPGATVLLQNNINNLVLLLQDNINNLVLLVQDNINNLVLLVQDILDEQILVFGVT
ncbi:hypothetical protein NIES4074_12900 [Cylindrospermum sp. NIES-4074]|nr:hypothetical protein NIES4074_12900 [Cylindrospermum sp. NIES-4074]